MSNLDNYLVQIIEHKEVVAAKYCKSYGSVVEDGRDILHFLAKDENIKNLSQGLGHVKFANKDEPYTGYSHLEGLEDNIYLEDTASSLLFELAALGELDREGEDFYLLDSRAQASKCSWVYTIDLDENQLSVWECSLGICSKQDLALGDAESATKLLDKYTAKIEQEM